MNHRAGLYDMVLIKENHIRAAGGVVAALEAAIPRARREGLEVEVEVTNEDEVRQALDCRPDRIMLDNMTSDRLAEAVRIVHETPAPRPLIEASGGVTLGTVRDIARTGVDYVSVGALTHSAPAMDYSLLVIDR
jgi:nicotinate-nucleotide pyrophosphorylase (carboxylating)